MASPMRRFKPGISIGGDHTILILVNNYYLVIAPILSLDDPFGLRNNLPDDACCHVGMGRVAVSSHQLNEKNTATGRNPSGGRIALMQMTLKNQIRRLNDAGGENSTVNRKNRPKLKLIDRSEA
ncbi:hypothetical protein [Ferribacterium limneticum]|uniref:hypothetical protein n=1 Tax=Ferribacterium limneticum TaxID=76259 RepID=UPI001CF9DC5C|nr:hypothetical protein [Ferribacterium limneticum]UCV19405.1 hypothetical protein KI610_02115 [Ferribacterium limneticum]